MQFSAVQKWRCCPRRSWRRSGTSASDETGFISERNEMSKATETGSRKSTVPFLVRQRAYRPPVLALF
jgi:hypothetical protein